MTRDDVIRLARNAGMEGLLTDVVCTLSELELFAHYAIEEFLTSSGQYLTNDATREAAIADAVSAERKPMMDADFLGVREAARQAWNAEADQYNQWDDLGESEKDMLIVREVERFHKIGAKP